MDGFWNQSVSGRVIHFLAPKPEEIDLHDLALGLSQLPRFTGQVRPFWSVANHSLLVAGILEPLATVELGRNWCSLPLWGLMHDSAEAITNDISKHLKSCLLVHDLDGEVVPFKVIEDRILEAIAARFNLPWPQPRPDLLQWADDVALATERRDLMAPSARPWTYKLPEPLAEKLRPDFEPEVTRLAFLAAFETLSRPLGGREAF